MKREDRNTNVRQKEKQKENWRRNGEGNFR